MRPLIEDKESPDSDLEIIIVTQPTGPDGRVWGTATVNGTNVRVELNS